MTSHVPRSAAFPATHIARKGVSHFRDFVWTLHRLWLHALPMARSRTVRSLTGVTALAVAVPVGLAAVVASPAAAATTVEFTTP